MNDKNSVGYTGPVSMRVTFTAISFRCCNGVRLVWIFLKANVVLDAVACVGLVIFTAQERNDLNQEAGRCQDDVNIIGENVMSSVFIFLHLSSFRVKKLVGRGCIIIVFEI